MWQSVELIDVFQRKIESVEMNSFCFLQTIMRCCRKWKAYLQFARAARIQAADRHRERVLDVLRYLRASKDLMLSPNMLRYHMFAYGIGRRHSCAPLSPRYSINRKPDIS